MSMRGESPLQDFRTISGTAREQIVLTCAIARKGTAERSCEGTLFRPAARLGHLECSPVQWLTQHNLADRCPGFGQHGQSEICLREIGLTSQTIAARTSRVSKSIGIVPLSVCTS